MPLSRGTRLGPCQIQSPLGAGAWARSIKLVTPAGTVRLTGTLTLWRAKRKMPAIHP